MTRCRLLPSLYVVAVITISLLIVSDLITLNTEPTLVVNIGKKDFFLGQLQINFNRLQSKRYSKSRMQAKGHEDTGNTQMRSQKKSPIFVRAYNSSVYMYSAIRAQYKISIQGTRTENRTTSTNAEVNAYATQFVINGWEYWKEKGSNFTCCYMLANASTVALQSPTKRNWLYLGKAKLQAKQYVCPINKDVTNSSSVAVELHDSKCPPHREYYIPVENLKPRKSTTIQTSSETISICAKLAYKSLDARNLVEWFEVHRMFGVDKVFAYLYKLNPEAQKVFEYYVKLGLAEVFRFKLPGLASVTREVGSKNMQSWNDEQVVLFDCQERARTFDYVAVVDTDEFIVPASNNLKNAWKTFFRNKLRKTNFAGLHFPVSIHATTWGPTNRSHPLFIGQYNSCTEPMLDRIKSVYMPSRVQPGSVSTHSFRPISGYKRGISDFNKATLHHFRGCRKEWLAQRSRQDVKKDKGNLYLGKNATKCYDLRRHPSPLMQNVADAVIQPVKQVVSTLQLR